ncbi:MAG: hypothetical protein ACHQ5A_05370 [Opitutales bacterium]
METPVQTALRLLDALEDLAAQETANLRNLDFVEAVQVLERSAPLVNRLAELAADPEVLALRPRIAALLDQRQQSASLLDAHLARVQSEMRRVDEARARLAKIAPVYGPGTLRIHSRLNTAA